MAYCGWRLCGQHVDSVGCGDRTQVAHPERPLPRCERCRGKWGWPVCDLRFSGDTLKVWDLDSERELRTLPGHSRGVTTVAVTPDAQRAVSASENNPLKVWDLGTGRVLATFTSDGAALCYALADDGKLIAAGDAGGHLHFLRLE